MQGRSWMAALTLAAGLTPAWLPAQTPTQKPVASVNPDEETATTAVKTVHVVKLKLAIAGLSAKGCDVEIKPGHAACKFEKKTQHVTSMGKVEVVLKDVETQSADRDCTFAITIREPGQAERTVRRGFRLNAVRGAEQSLDCLLNSPSRIARVNTPEATKR